MFQAYGMATFGIHVHCTKHVGWYCEVKEIDYKAVD
jgi:hypothetical protein